MIGRKSRHTAGPVGGSGLSSPPCVSGSVFLPAPPTWAPASTRSASRSRSTTKSRWRKPTASRSPCSGEGAGRLDEGAAERGRARSRHGIRGRGPSLFRVCGSDASTVSRSVAGWARARPRGWVDWLAANALLDAPLDRDALLTLAARAEGHPDNVAAALLGGLTVSCATEGGCRGGRSLPVPSEIAMGGAWCRRRRARRGRRARCCPKRFRGPTRCSTSSA